MARGTEIKFNSNFITVAGRVPKFRKAQFITADDASSIGLSFAFRFRNRQLSGINSLGRPAKPLRKRYAKFKANFVATGGKNKGRYTYGRKFLYSDAEWRKEAAKKAEKGKPQQQYRTVISRRRGMGIQRTAGAPYMDLNTRQLKFAGGSAIRDLYLTGEMWSGFKVTSRTQTVMRAAFTTRAGRAKARRMDRLDPFVGFSNPEGDLVFAEVEAAVWDRFPKMIEGLSVQ